MLWYVKSVGELDAVTPHVQFDERRGGNGLVRRGEGTDDLVGNSLLLLLRYRASRRLYSPYWKYIVQL